MPVAISCYAQKPPIVEKKSNYYRTAAGYRHYTTGAVSYQGTQGLTWSSTPYDESNGHDVNFNSNNVNPVNRDNYSYGFTVRCVAR